MGVVHQDSMASATPVKMVIVGDGSIGKTCLLAAIKDPDLVMSDEYAASMVDNTVEQWPLDGKIQDIDVWDTAGQEQFEMLRKMAYPASNVVVLGFCMTDKDSLQNILHGDGAWTKEITNNIGPYDSWVLVGTKSDLWDEWKDDDAKKAKCVTMEDCYKVAEELKAKSFLATSAKTHTNMAELQTAILRAAIANRDKKDLPAFKRPAPPKPATPKPVTTLGAPSDAPAEAETPGKTPVKKVEEGKAAGITGAPSEKEPVSARKLKEKGELRKDSDGCCSSCSIS